MRVRAQVRAHLVVFLVFYWLFSLILCVAHALGQMKVYVSLRHHISFMVMMFPFSQVMNWMKIPESTFLFLLFLSQCNSLSIPALYHTPFLLCCRIILSFSLSSIFGLVLFRSALSSIPRSSFSKMVIRLFVCLVKIFLICLEIGNLTKPISPDKCHSFAHDKSRNVSTVCVRKRNLYRLFWPTSALLFCCSVSDAH